MILGIGTDIVQIPRIERIFKQYGLQFVNKILNLGEQKSNSHRISSSFLAKRFAAKEAVAKAFGQGIGKPLRFKDISIINNALGKPEVQVIGQKNNEVIELSLSDDYPVAIAFVVIHRI